MDIQDVTLLGNPDATVGDRFTLHAHTIRRTLHLLGQVVVRLRKDRLDSLAAELIKELDWILRVELLHNISHADIDRVGIDRDDVVHAFSAKELVQITVDRLLSPTNG